VSNPVAGRDHSQRPQRVIVTGGPGAGKSALLAALARRGYPCAPDSARMIIQERRRRGLSARPDPAEFATGILRNDIEQYRHAPTDVDVVFFDRAIPDALCMLSDLGRLSLAEAGQAVTEYRYCRQVFLAPPWQEIYTTDGERDQDFADAVRVHRRASDWYEALGFELIELPLVPIEERCAFVLEKLGMSPNP
jgi:predicted ATPase